MRREWSLRDDIVRPDGTVPDIDRSPLPYWNNAASAATGRRECGGRQPEGADIGRQPVIGLHKDRGPSDGATSSGRASGQFFMEHAP